MKIRNAVGITFRIKSKGLIVRGKNVIINCNLLAEGKNSIDHFSVLEGGEIKLGRFSTISSHCVLRGPIEIGRFTQIGPQVTIFSRNHPVDSLSINVSRNFMGGARKKLQNELEKKVIIGADVWIGSGVIILPGVNIGDGAVVGAGAVVTKDVQPYTMVAGVPAKKIRDRFGEELIEILMKIRWWERTDSFIEKNHSLFMDPDISVEKLRTLMRSIESPIPSHIA